MFHQPNFKKIINSEAGRIVISVLLGLGLATLFNKVCKDKNCIIFNGPVLSEIDGKIYKYGDKCYSYKMKPDKCDSTKRVIDISDKEISV
jgi:hypothetical protein